MPTQSSPFYTLTDPRPVAAIVPYSFFQPNATPAIFGDMNSRSAESINIKNYRSAEGQLNIPTPLDLPSMKAGPLQQTVPRRHNSTPSSAIISCFII
jgi:hypothetical protein